MPRWNIVGLCLIALLVIADPTRGQIPVATGRTIALSNPAWSLFIPSDYQSRGAVADLIVHFHGDPATFRNNAKYARLNAIIVTVNYGGLSSAYQTPFQSDTGLFNSLLNEAQAKVRAEPDFADNLVFDRLAVSSFSAGYGAVREVLKQQAYYDAIDMILAADTIHAGFVSFPGNLALVSSQMTDWRRFATDAASGNKTFLVTHSQVDPVTYASTTLTANDLIGHVGAAAQSYNVNGLGTLNFYRRAQTGGFTVLGATGADADSHLEHLRYIGEFLEDLPIAKVPEPAGMGLLAGGAAVLRRRR